METTDNPRPPDFELVANKAELFEVDEVEFLCYKNQDNGKTGNIVCRKKETERKAKENEAEGPPPVNQIVLKNDKDDLEIDPTVVGASFARTSSNPGQSILASGDKAAVIEDSDNEDCQILEYDYDIRIVDPTSLKKKSEAALRKDNEDDCETVPVVSDSPGTSAKPEKITSAFADQVSTAEDSSNSCQILEVDNDDIQNEAANSSPKKTPSSLLDPVSITMKIETLLKDMYKVDWEAVPVVISSSPGICTKAEKITSSFADQAANCEDSNNDECQILEADDIRIEDPISKKTKRDTDSRKDNESDQETAPVSVSLAGISASIPAASPEQITSTSADKTVAVEEWNNDDCQIMEVSPSIPHVSETPTHLEVETQDINENQRMLEFVEKMKAKSKLLCQSQDIYIEDNRNDEYVVDRPCHGSSNLPRSNGLIPAKKRQRREIILEDRYSKNDESPLEYSVERPYHGPSKREHPNSQIRAQKRQRQDTSLEDRYNRNEEFSLESSVERPYHGSTKRAKSQILAKKPCHAQRCDVQPRCSHSITPKECRSSKGKGKCSHSSKCKSKCSHSSKKERKRSRSSNRRKHNSCCGGHRSRCPDWGSSHESSSSSNESYRSCHDTSKRSKRPRYQRLSSSSDNFDMNKPLTIDLRAKITSRRNKRLAYDLNRPSTSYGPPPEYYPDRSLPSTSRGPPPDYYQDRNFPGTPYGPPHPEYYRDRSVTSTSYATQYANPHPRHARHRTPEDAEWKKKTEKFVKTCKAAFHADEERPRAEKENNLKRQKEDSHVEILSKQIADLRKQLGELPGSSDASSVGSPRRPYRSPRRMADVSVGPVRESEAHVKVKQEVINEKDDFKEEKGRFPNDFFCNICQLQLNSEVTWNTHLNGKKHVKQLKLLTVYEIAKGSIDVPATRPVLYENAPRFGDPQPGRKRRRVHEIPKLQTTIDSIRYKPIAGLEFLEEIISRTPGQPIDVDYYCDLCDAPCKPSSVMPHLMGIKHRLRFLQERSPRYYNSNKDRRDSKFKEEIARKLWDYEKVRGRGKIKVFHEVDDPKTRRPFDMPMAVEDAFYSRRSLFLPKIKIEKKAENDHVKKEQETRRKFEDPNLDMSKSDFYCKLCDSHMNCFIMWENHIRGNKHLTNLKKTPGESISKRKSYKMVGETSKLERIIAKEANDELIVGLDYIRETRSSAGEMYNCFLCGGCMTNDVLDHLRLLKHRTKYLEVMEVDGKSSAIGRINSLNLPDGPRESLINEECYNLLDKYGRGTVEVYKNKN